MSVQKPGFWQVFFREWKQTIRDSVRFVGAIWLVIGLRIVVYGGLFAGLMLPLFVGGYVELGVFPWQYGQVPPEESISIWWVVLWTVWAGLYLSGWKALIETTNRV